MPQRYRLIRAAEARQPSTSHVRLGQTNLAFLPWNAAELRHRPVRLPSHICPGALMRDELVPSGIVRSLPLWSIVSTC